VTGDAGAAGGGEATSSGRVAAELAEEFPGLSLRYATVGRGSGGSTREVKERLRALSDRFSGPQAVNLRHQPIPWAYRVFFRHIGLDPDVQRTPVEERVFERIKHGGFKSESLLDDALTIAIVESGVAVRAFDADRLDGAPQIRSTTSGETLEGRPGELPAGTLAIADAERPVALLFGALAAGRGVDRRTSRTMLVAIGVGGVPAIAVEEALWLTESVLES
jgi:DNA/RNA-binding domain of Phe-tRNA-synthetase-like protein